MSFAILGLTSGFILVLVFLFYLTLKTDLKLYLKFLAVIVIAGFYIIQYESLQQHSGWPSTDNLPEKFVLIASEVREPDQKTGEAGVIYWWVRDTTVDGQPPRVFQLPYAVEDHKNSAQVIEEQKKGSQYIGRRTEESSSVAREGFRFEKISKSDLFKKEK